MSRLQKGVSGDSVKLERALASGWITLETQCYGGLYHIGGFFASMWLFLVVLPAVSVYFCSRFVSWPIQLRRWLTLTGYGDINVVLFCDYSVLFALLYMHTKLYRFLVILLLFCMLEHCPPNIFDP